MRAFASPTFCWANARIFFSSPADRCERLLEPFQLQVRFGGPVQIPLVDGVGGFDVQVGRPAYDAR